MPQSPSPRFDSFVMLAEMRTGSNFLEANLNALAGVSCFGEMFNPHFIGKKDCLEMLGVTLPERVEQPKRLLNRMRESTEDLTGFRYFHDHDPRVFNLVMNDPACAKIVLTRNPLDSYVSLKIAQATGQWKLTNAKRAKRAQITFEPEEFTAHLEQLQSFQAAILQRLQRSGQTAFYIGYDDIPDLEVLNGLATFLGVSARLERVDDTLKKQNPETLAEKVRNVDAMERSLAQIDTFALGKTPNFEPRRPARVPLTQAAQGVPLLHLPLQGGPVAALAAWLGAFKGPEGQQGLLQDFTQKSLRHWQQAHPTHRSFTVLRHPLLRAFAAFEGGVRSGLWGEWRAILRQSHHIDLPAPDADFPTPDAHRTAFAAFLAQLKSVLSGQMGARIDPHLASQTASVQAWAQIAPPSLVLREADLTRDLGHLATSLGHDSPPYQDTAGAALVARLRAIHHPDLDRAARALYERDYLNFGFENWRAP